ncbi:isopeptide-forming domain-containing fimbrial protein [Olsenella sp. YH-ols2221]|uniref:isopeptide-forming domain-containing fimbrial protein n=1 Tax=Olsenella kribbiana TaxID=3115221 RepID=UPI002EDB206F
MRKTKDLLKSALSAILAVAMALVLVPANALAADGYTLTLTGTTTGHTYEAYQIFKGDLSGSTLSNVDWGSGIDSTKTGQLIAALKTDDTLKATFGSVTDAASVAEALSNAKDDDAVAQAFATVVSQYLSTTKTSKDSAADKTEISSLSAGYYLVKDKDNSVDSTKKDAYTRFILKVVADTSAAVKSNVPTVEKKVKDTNDSTGETTGWQDSADYDINDWVPYQITGTMPSNIDDYKTYKYSFTDTMSKGLTYDKNDADHKATIKIGDKDVTSSFKETVTANQDGTTTVTWACDNLKGIEGVTLTKDSKVIVTYSAKLNDQAVIGSAGNPNEVYLTFSNNPNKGGEGNTGKTPTDKNIVFTYKTVVNKVDQDKKTLAGAGFTLQKKQSDGTYKDVKTFTAGDQTTFEFTGLDDGDYKLIESTTPAGYNTIAPVEFTISATHDEKADDPKLLTLSGDVTSGTAEFTADTNAGSLTTDVVNKKGSVLPSTGGMGTTMLYVGGAALAAIAAFGIYQLRKKENED